jgi:hypothetical protein
MKFAKIRFQSDEACARALKELATRMREEANVRILLDVEDTTENAKFFTEFKKTLKERFRQIDIWIISFEIRII